MILVTPDGDIADGEGPRHAEYPIHTEVVAARDDVGAVVHTHAAHAVAFGALDATLLPVSHEGTLFVPPDVARFTRTADLILTPDLGRAVGDALGDRTRSPREPRDRGGRRGRPDGRDDGRVPRARLPHAAGREAAGRVARWSDDEEALAERAYCFSPQQLEMAWAYVVRVLESSSGG